MTIPLLHCVLCTCRCFPSRSLTRGERLPALPAGCLQERDGAAQTGAGQEPADEERGGQHARSATQLPAAGSARHAEGRRLASAHTSDLGSAIHLSSAPHTRPPWLTHWNSVRDKKRGRHLFRKPSFVWEQVMKKHSCLNCEICMKSC